MSLIGMVSGFLGIRSLKSYQSQVAKPLPPKPQSLICSGTGLTRSILPLSALALTACGEPELVKSDLVENFEDGNLTCETLNGQWDSFGFKIFEVQYGVLYAEADNSSWPGFFLKLNGQDVSNYTHITFDVRGNRVSKIKVEAFENQSGRNPESYAFIYLDYDMEWATLSLDLNGIQNLHQFQVLGAGGTRGSIEIDNVRFEAYE